MLELWEDVSKAGKKLPVDERHYVRVLFNGEEVAVPPEATEAGQPLPLAQFKAHVTRPYALTQEEHAETCEMTFDHEAHGETPVDTSSMM